MQGSPLRDLDSSSNFDFNLWVKAVRLQPECLPKRRIQQAERESEELGFGNSAINVWGARCRLRTFSLLDRS